MGLPGLSRGKKCGLGRAIFLSIGKIELSFIVLVLVAIHAAAELSIH